MKLVLEARHLFDGSVHAVTNHAAHLADTTHQDNHHAGNGHHDAAASVTPAAASAAPQDGTGHHRHDDIPGLKYNPNATQLLVVDTRVENWQSLVDGISPDVQIVLVHPNEDGLAAVTKAIDSHHDLTAVQFLTHGDPGSITLGNAVINADTLYAHGTELASWGDHLAPGADIEFWGCDVGQGSNGQAFVDAVHTFTGATVGASTDPTGSVSGADWTLENTTGPLAVGAPFTAAAMAGYHDALITSVQAPTISLSAITGTLTGSADSGDVLLGDTFTQTVSFTNNDPSLTGYGPVVNLFVKTTGTETATLQSATYLGANISISGADKIVFATDNIAGDPHNGEVGAYNPFMLDSTGKPTWIAASSVGMVAGDTMFVLVLPLGSVTPGEPEADITLTYTADASSDATAHSNTKITTVAQGFYQFGSDALNNPTTDPVVAESLTTALANKTQASVSLLYVTETAQTQYGENETATGENNPLNYELNIIAAPALASNGINGLTLTANLPDGIVYNGGTITVAGGSATAVFSGGTTVGSVLEGGQVTVTFGSSFTTTTKVDVPVYVPQYFEDGQAILQSSASSVDGHTIGANYQTTIDEHPAYSYSTAGGWHYATGNATETLSASNVGEVSFVAKGLAIQVVDTTTNGAIAPGKTGITETLRFEVSDYVDLSDLVITNVLGDGFTLDPSSPSAIGAGFKLNNFGASNADITNGTFGNLVSPVITGTGTQQSVSSGQTANGFWTVSQNSDGTTEMVFDVGALLNSLAGNGGTITGGKTGTGLGGGSTVGTITYNVNVLDSYKNSHVISGTPNNLLEGDSATNTVGNNGSDHTTANVDERDSGTGPVAATGGISTGTTSDTSGLTDTVPNNTMKLLIDSVNGTPIGSDATSQASIVIKPGDVVTYHLEYDLNTTNDFGNNANDLLLKAFLPLPVFNAPTLTLAGSQAATEGTTANLFFASDNFGYSVAGVTPSADSTANSVTFDVGKNNNTADVSNGTGKIDIYFSVKASNNPFANGLFLSNLSQSNDFNATNASTSINAAALQLIKLAEPEVVTKTGIVAVNDDSGSAITSPSAPAFSNDPNDTASLGTGITYSNTLGQGTIYNSPRNNDQDASGADAGDVVSYVTTIDNVGSATAYGVEVKGSLPANGTISNFQIRDASGTVLNLTDASQVSDMTGTAFPLAASAQGSYFSGGLRINNGATGLAAGSTYYVSYDVTLDTAQATAAKLTQSGSLVNWWSNSGVVGNAALGFVTSSTTAIGVTAAAITDSASLTLNSPTLAKVVTSSTQSVAGNDPLTASNNVVQGDTVTYTLTLTLPEGTTDLSGGVTIADVLPSGMTFGSLGTVTFNGVTSSLGTSSHVTATTSGSTVSFHLGTLTASGDHGTTNTVTIVYTATVGSNLTVAATAFTNTATVSFNNATGTGTAQATATVNEVNPNIVETIHEVGNGVTDGTVFDGESLAYTVTLTNNGNARADGVNYLIEVPSAVAQQLTLGTVTGPGSNGGSLIDTHNTATNGDEILEISSLNLAAGTSSSFTFGATVNPNLAAGTSIVVLTPNDNLDNGGGTNSADGHYYSMPSNAGHVYSGTAGDTVSIGTISSSIGVIGESNATASQTVNTGTGLFGTNGDNTQATAVTDVNGATVTGSNSVNATVGDVVRYSAYATLPEGSNNLTLTVTLPKGVALDETNGSITVALVSPDGTDFNSTIAGTGTLQQGYTTFDPTKALATFQLTINSSDVTFSTDSTTGITTVNFNLGTLTDNQHATGADYAIVQFNGIVQNAATDVNGASLQAGVAANSTASTDKAVVKVVEPHLTLTKAIDTTQTGGGIVYNGDGSADVSYVETITNTGTTAAYNVSLDDPLAASNVSFQGSNPLTDDVTATGALAVALTNLNTDVTATGSLAVGGVETIKYTEHVANVSLGVADKTATVTYTSLSTASGETLKGTTTGASGTATGSRDGVNAGTNALNTYKAQVTTGLAVVSGKVWNDIGPTNSTFGETGSHDTGLSNVTVNGNDTYVTGVNASGTNVTATLAKSVTTDTNGNYVILTPDGSVTVSVPKSDGTSGPASNEQSVFVTSGTPPANSTTTAVTTGTLTVAAGTPTTANFAYQTPDTAPSLGSVWGNPSFTGTTPVATYIEGTAVALSSGAAVTDTEIDESSQNYDGSVLTIQRYSAANTKAPSATDIFVGMGSGGTGVVLSGGNVSLNGTVVGTYTQSGGVLAVTFTQTTTTAATVNTVLNGIGYAGTDTNTISSGIKIGATIDDHNQTNLQGTGGDKTSVPVFVTLNEIPGAATVTYTEPNDSSAQTPAVALDSGLTLTASTPKLLSATVTLSGAGGTGSALTEDQLFASGTLPSDITAAFSGGVLTLTATDTTNGATVAEFQSVLQSVKFYDNADNPQSVSSTSDASKDRTVTIVVQDTNHSSVTAATIKARVVNDDDSPVLGGKPVILIGTPTGYSDPTVNTAAPVGAVGTLVSAFTANGNVTDVDGPNDVNGSTAGTAGIAIVGADTTQGNWWYSTDNGAHWTQFAGSSMTAVSATNALHLVGDANTLVYFQATSASWSGTVPTALTFRAWDQADGVANGNLSALPSTGTLGSGLLSSPSTGAQAAAYSSATESIPLVQQVYIEPNVTDTTAPPPNTLAGKAISIDTQFVMPTSVTGNFASATVTLADTTTPGTDGTKTEDVLTFTGSSSTGDITGNYTNGVLTLTSAGGSATAAQFQAAIQLVQFYDNSQTPSTLARSAVFALTTSGNVTTQVGQSTILVVPNDESPILNNKPVILSGTPSSFTDPTVNTAAPNGAVGTLVSAFTANGNVTDGDNANNVNGSTAGTAGIAIVGADTTQGNWWYSTDNGAHWTEFAGSSMTAVSATNALHLVGDANTLVYFQATSANWTGSVPTALTFRAWDQADGVANGNLSALPSTGTLGSGLLSSSSTGAQAAAYSSATESIPLVQQVYIEPNVTDATTPTTLAAHAITIDSGFTMPTSVTGNFASATVTLADTTTPGVDGTKTEDMLTFTGNGSTGDITAAYTNGVLTLTSTGGSATAAQFQAAIQAVKYYDNSQTPSTLARSAVFALTTSGNVTTQVGQSTILVVPNNDSPVLHNTTPGTVTSTEDDPAPTNGSLPTDSILVSTLGNSSNANITDTDGANAHDGTTPASSGVVITQIDTSEGTWWYTTNNGATWTQMTGISPTNALHLSGDANTRIYFQPDANYNNTSASAIAPAITVQGWDGFDGAANGSLSAVPSGAGTGTGAASAYSSAIETFNLVVNPVNDAPIASGSASIAPPAEDSTPAGTTVTSLLGQSTVMYNDSIDTVAGGSTGTPAAGIAITGNAATPNEGSWQYSTDGGNTWTSIPSTGLDDGHAIVIPATASIRFLPQPNYNGVVGSLTAHVSDGTNLPATGGPQSIASTEGGTGGWSIGTITINTSVTAVNDAPIAAPGPIEIVPVVQATRQNPTAVTVSTLYGGSFSDTADQQQTTADPTGSMANGLAGIAVTGTATPDQGAWQYSTDGGNTWTSIPTNVGENNAVIIPASASLRFLPNDSFNGTSGTLVAHLIDSSNGAITTVTTGVNLTVAGAEGGISAISSGTVPLTTQVPALPPPIETPPANIEKTPQQQFPLSEIGFSSVDRDHPNGSLDRPEIPQVSLVGSVGNHFIIEQQQAIISVPENLFTDSFPGAQLTFAAESPDGSPLPPWLDFDARNLTFTGLPPAGSHGAVDVTIVARDQYGNEATASFRILVGRPPGDIASMLNQTNSGPPSTDGLAPVDGRNNGQRNGGGQNGNGQGANGQNRGGQGTNGQPAPGQQGSIALPDHVVHLADAGGPGQVDMFASMAQPAGHGRAGFSAQLREAGRPGQLAQARRLLDNITAERPAQPAA